MALGQRRVFSASRSNLGMCCSERKSLEVCMEFPCAICPDAKIPSFSSDPFLYWSEEGSLLEQANVSWGEPCSGILRHVLKLSALFILFLLSRRPAPPPPVGHFRAQVSPLQCVGDLQGCWAEKCCSGPPILWLFDSHKKVDANTAPA